MEIEWEVKQAQFSTIIFLLTIDFLQYFYTILRSIFKAFLTLLPFLVLGKTFFPDRQNELKTKTF